MKFHTAVLAFSVIALVACGKGAGDPPAQPAAPDAPTDPAPTDPEPTDPAPTDPEPTDPAPTDPAPTDPAPTDPEPTDPEPANPEPANPEASTVVTDEVTYEGGGVTMKGYLAWDSAKTGPRPGVIVVHEWWGHNDYARRRARMLAELGYTALAVDMFGDGKTADHPKDAMAFVAEATSDTEAALARFEAGRAVLAARPETDADKIAAVGYCFGGAVVLNAARAGHDLAAVVSFHGSLGASVPAKEGAVKAPILVLNGADDPLIPAEQVKGFEEEMTAAGATFEVVNYEGATHAFTNPEATAKGEEFGLPLAYDAEADGASWEAMRAFLAKAFGPDAPADDAPGDDAPGDDAPGDDAPADDAPADDAPAE